MPANEVRIEGLKELDRKLGQLGAKLGKKTLQKALRNSAKTLIYQMRQKVPVGTRYHKSYKGRTLPPGYLKRHIKVKTSFSPRYGSARLTFGVSPEAYYGINFLDLGPIHVTRRNKKPIKPYTIRGRPWFLSTLIANRTNIEQRFKAELKAEIREVTNGR